MPPSCLRGVGGADFSGAGPGEDCIRLRWKDLRVDRRILRQIVRIGVPSALQMAITSFSNVFVQSYINFFGLDCMSGWTTYSKLDQFIILPVQSLGLAATTFVGQNLGTDQVERAKKGTRDAFFLSVGITVVISAAAIALAPWLVAFFNDKPEVVAYGTLFLRNMCPCYVFICVNQVYSGSLRGRASASRPPTSCWPPSWSSGRFTSTSWPITSPTPSCPSPWATPPGGWCAASSR